jgi:hypothetical protein
VLADEETQDPMNVPDPERTSEDAQDRTAERAPGEGGPTPRPRARIYADFNEFIHSPRNPERRAVPLDTMGSLRDLANAGVVLYDGMPLTIYADSDEDEDLEADTVAYYESAQKRWIAELDERGYRYVPAQDRGETPPFLCVRCRTPLDAVLARRGLRIGDRCPSCGEPIHRPIAPPGART